MTDTDKSAPSPRSEKAVGESQEKIPRIPLLGEPAPHFRAHSSQGEIRFPDDFKGKWVILFSHPADFTPVCTTEFMSFARIEKELESLNCKLVGLSVDSQFSHIAWLRTIKEKIEWNGMKNLDIQFPVIADSTMEVATKYGMIQPGVSDKQTIRAVFFIDPEATIRAMLYYPMSNGRNFDEIKRLIVAMQTSDKHKIATPADWKPGQKVIMAPPGSYSQATKRVQSAGQDYECLDWFFCLKKLPDEK